MKMPWLVVVFLAQGENLVFFSLVGDDDEESAEEQEDPGDGATDEGQEPAGGHRCTMC